MTDFGQYQLIDFDDPIFTNQDESKINSVVVETTFVKYIADSKRNNALFDYFGRDIPPLPIISWSKNISSVCAGHIFHAEIFVTNPVIRISKSIVLHIKSVPSALRHSMAPGRGAACPGSQISYPEVLNNLISRSSHSCLVYLRS